MVPTPARIPLGNATTHNTIEQSANRTVKPKADMSEYIRRLVDEAPPLRPEQIDRIAVLMRGDIR